MSQKYLAVDVSCDTVDIQKNTCEFEFLEKQMVAYWNDAMKFIHVITNTSNREIVQNIAMKNFVYNYENKLNVFMEKLNIDLKELRSSCYEKNLHTTRFDIVICIWLHTRN